MEDRAHGLPGAVVSPTNELYKINGRIARGYEITVPPDVFEQYRHGYRCIACQHFPQPTPFPEHCCEPYCRFPIRRDQLARLEFADRGESDRVPDPTQDDYHARRQRLLDNDDIWLPEIN